MPIRILIDGPAFSGKTTVAEIVARELQIPFLNAEPIYRALAQLRKEIAKVKGPDGDCSIEELVNSASLYASPSGDPLRPNITRGDGRSLYSSAYNTSIKLDASELKAYASVRKIVADVMRRFAEENHVILAERLICNEIPAPDVNIALDADTLIRALRYRETLKAEKKEITSVQAVKDIEESDNSYREKLDKKAAPYYVIDTSTISAKEAASQVIAGIRGAFSFLRLPH